MILKLEEIRKKGAKKFLEEVIKKYDGNVPLVRPAKLYLPSR
jgi:hypothetical protein